MAPMQEDVPVGELDDAASDEDFNPDEAPQDEESSSSEDEAQLPISESRKAKGKRKRGGDAIDAELDSGDEATIQERRKKRKSGSDADFSSDDEGGEGGFVRTRAQRLQEKQERKPLASLKGATIDVDAAWTRLSALPIGRPLDLPKPIEEPQYQELEEKYITIKRTTKFAGEVTTEERRVPKSSAEARLYLEEQEREKATKSKQPQGEEKQPGEEDATTPHGPPIRRPLRRPSRFEPNPFGEVRSLPPHLQLKWPRNKMAAPPLMTTNKENFSANSKGAGKLPQATKLNVVDKSRHDWAGFVDKEGIAEELDEYGRSKQSYLSRQDFLNRTEQQREARSKDARLQASK